jgi:agmatine deiminase
MIESQTSFNTCACYTNYFVANGVVVVPVFGNVNDDRAIKILQEQYPDRKVVGVNCVALFENGGGIHCGTPQQPGATPRWPNST